MSDVRPPGRKMLTFDSHSPSSAGLAARNHLQAVHQPAVVPFIALRTGEEPVDQELTLRDAPGEWGLAYADEVPEDRDVHGVLWQRHTQSLGRSGKPAGPWLTGQVHPGRLRETMVRLHCPVCNYPAGRSGDGWLFLEPLAAEPVDGRLTTWPAVCLEHALTYARYRPDLRDGYTAVRSAEPVLYGVRGRRLRFAGTAFETAEHDVLLPYEHARGRWIVAERLVRKLLQTTTVIQAVEVVAG
ncbi:hypothetical protein [Streptomyces sp. NPDC045470]|uniref:hypothetical protein n=1 Tax=Streptomyces sp. NPDC045470 TaxID=3155469 RepID=UPI0033FC3D39